MEAYGDEPVGLRRDTGALPEPVEFVSQGVAVVALVGEDRPVTDALYHCRGGRQIIWELPGVSIA